MTIIPRFLFNSFNLALKELYPKHHPSYYISPPTIFHSMNKTKNHRRLKIPFKTGVSTESKLAGIRTRTVITCRFTTNSSSQTYVDSHSVIMYTPQTSVIFRLQVYCNLQHTEYPISIIIICHVLGLNRPVSVSSNSLFEGLPNRLRPLGHNSALFLASYCSFLLHVVANLMFNARTMGIKLLSVLRH